MSVINQVLNQLEQRGVHAATEQTMMRAVPRDKHRLVMPLLALGLVLTIGIAAWQWMQARKPVLSTVEGPQVVAASAVQRQPAAVAIPAPAAPVASAPVVAAPAAAVPISEAQLTAMIPPVLRPAPESGSIPQPSNLRQDPGQVASTKPLALSTAEGSGRPASTGSGQAASTGSGQALRDVKSRPVPGRAEKPAPEEACPEPCGRIEERTANTAPPARPAKPQPIQAAAPNAQAAAQPPADVSPMKQVSPAQHADAEFSKAVTSMQQGHIADAIAGYEAVLRLDAGHDAARQALVALLLESKLGADAVRVLQDGLKNKPEHTGFAMLLARLQVEHGAVDHAAATLEKSLPYAGAQADYQAFYAALLQRQNRHKEAVAYYQVALQLVPGNGVWQMGYGISLQAMQRTDDARDAFRRALESKTLNPELQAFVQQKLRGL